MLKNLLLVSFGGGAGSVLRYLLSLAVPSNQSHVFPWATAGANLLGCFLIGLLMAVLSKNIQMSTELKLLLITGFCGGFTTFSTFSAETLQLFQNGYTVLALAYIGASVVLGLAAVALGFLFAQVI